MPHWKTTLRWLGVIAGLITVVLLLRGRLPSPAAISDSLKVADTGWLLVAAGAEVVSMAMFARQQRRLLTAFGVTMPRHRALALAYSRSAISISVPAGSAVSAAYAFKQFRTGGASRRAATTVMVLSGLLSAFALVLLYVTGLLATAAVHLARAWREQPELIESIVLMVIAVGLLITFLAWPRARTLPRDKESRFDRLAVRRPRLGALLRPLVESVRGAREIAGRHWALALAAATVNWLTDLLCLYAAARAFHLPVDVATIGAVYLTVQVVRQIPLTPGGIGVIEVSLLAGLVSAGAPEAAAAAAVLVYRLLSCWLILPVGALGALVLRRPYPVRSGSTLPAEPASPHPDTPLAPRQEPPRYRSTAAHV